jgi:2-succinyl-5-enolpyruvyl-6-hydroxy-3-cyclohexene-1-carboxylate synthase
VTLPNRNLLWATVIVDELARSGVENAVIAPGSRSTPLVIALAQHPRIKVYSLIDERSAAFFALGIGLATGKPAALLCSSGTATANFYPAIIEAHYSNVPMLVLTADRPHELRDSGANQTVDQVRMFGNHVLWSVDVATPESNPSEVMIRSLRTLANRAYATARGPIGGPVHLNFPFRKPLEPTPVPTDNTGVMGSPREGERPYTAIYRGKLLPTAEQINDICAVIERSPRGLVIAGPRTPRGLGAALARFARATGYPVLADPLSGLRWSSDVDVIGGYETFVPGSALFDGVDLIIHVGALPASKALEDVFVKNSVPNVVLVTENGVWTDPYHRLSHLVHADATATFNGLVDSMGALVVDAGWAQAWRDAEAATWDGIDAQRDAAFFDGGAIGTISELMPSGSNLFVASSLPVRHLEQYGKPDEREMRVYCNRGASGIDGTVSSAFGVAAVSPAPTVLITGDLAFYHDMNGLLAAKRTGAKLVVVLINNDGGGIFKRLPINGFEPHFTELFLTPHGLDFEPAARLYGFDYACVMDYTALREAFTVALDSPNSVIIEARTNAESDLAARAALMRQVTTALQTS